MNEFLRSDLVLRRFLDSLRDYAIVVLDEEGIIIDWNAGARTLKGFDADEVIGTHFSRFYTPEAVAVGHPERELAAATSMGRYEEEGWRVRKDGTRFWAQVVITAIYDDNGALCGFGKIVQDRTERKQAAEQSANVMKLLELTARTDYLTGLDNRRSFDRALAATLSAAKRHARPLSLAMIDLDRFKHFNDEFGHQRGDTYLKRATDSWRESLRPEDFLARYGGEEFVVFLPDTELPDAIIWMERLRVASPRPLTCSIGLTAWDGTQTADELIGRADRALYQAKASGRNCVSVAAPSDVADNGLVHPSARIGRSKSPRIEVLEALDLNARVEREA